jgi:hypothetical protein
MASRPLALEARGVGLTRAASAPLFRQVDSSPRARLVRARRRQRRRQDDAPPGALRRARAERGLRPHRARGRAGRPCASRRRRRSPPGLLAFAQDPGGLAASLRGRLALDRAPIERWTTLSPGERKRWQIGEALWREPDVLLLDEPTNHLDDDGRALLVGALRRFRGVGGAGVARPRAARRAAADHHPGARRPGRRVPRGLPGRLGAVAGRGPRAGGGPPPREGPGAGRGGAPRRTRVASRRPPTARAAPAGG